MLIEEKHIIADEGKIFRRKGTTDVFGNEIYLGYSYYKNGEKLETPHLDTPDDFEEIDAPIEEILDDTNNYIETSISEMPD